MATNIDMTFAGATVNIDGTLFLDAAAVGSGTGNYNTFLLIDDNDGNMFGFNSDDAGPPDPSNPNMGTAQTHTVLLSTVPIYTDPVTLIQYYEFRIDLNEPNNAVTGQISLDAFKIYSSSSGTIETLAALQAATLEYNMDGSILGDVSLLWDETSTGSGTDDYAVLIPISNFAGLNPATTYMYLYVEMGYVTNDPILGSFIDSGGFEEWNLQSAGTVTGTKFLDLNGDGIRLGAGEVGLGGVTVWIDNDFDGVAEATDNNGVLDAGERSTVTAADGTYTFYGVPLGTWRVYEVVPAGYTRTTGPYETVTVSAVGAVAVVDPIGNQPPTFDVSGTKFTDANGDGLTAGDVGLGGVTIFIDVDGSLTNNAGDLTTTTAANGTWSFNDLNITYTGKIIYEVLPSGYVQTLGAAGYAITGTDQTGLNFANFEKFDISGTKFTDANGNGLTAGDVGLGGVTIFIDVDGSLTNNAGDLSTVTAANGTWSFTNLGVGYAGKLVYEVLPSGYVQTLGAAGYAITGTSGADQTGLNFANFEKFDISGTKFTDANGDGLTAGDVGLGGVTIFIDVDGSLTNNAGDLTTTTAADGTWSFTNLGVGYAGKLVYEVLPSGYVQTLGAAGYAITGTSGADQTGLNFANFPLFNVSGTKFTDANGDGLTAGDVGLGGVTIFIDVDGSLTNNAGDLSTVTAANGTWSFTNLAASNIGKTIYEVLPSGYVQTLGQAGYTITGTQTGLNFANFEKFDISGTKFTDLNGDGLTAGDSGLGGVTIFIDVDGSLTNNAGDLSTVTAADGTWSFTNLGVGYAGKLVYEVLPSGYVQTLGAAGYAITGTSGADQTGLNFANFEKFDISGTKFTDLNGDGLTAGDSGLGGVTIFIDVDGSLTNNAGDLSTVTAADGTWSFTNLGVGYAGKLVYEVLPSGYVQTLGAAGYAITGTSGADQTGLNFANFEKFDISGTKFTDLNGDGLTAGDSGLGGVTIFIDVDGSLTNNAGDLSTVTAADGTWSFTNLGVGYAGKLVYEVLPSGYVQTLGAAGYAITGTSGADQTGLNFANFEKFDISGTKFTDLNGDGLTAGDSGLGGVTIFIDVDGSLTNNAGDLSTVTAADGTWSFTNLGVGYAGKLVYEVLPSGYVQTLGAAGYAITGTSGADQTGLNFANFEKFDISGTKFTDLNGDGLTAGDSGLGGVTIFIDVDGSLTNNAGDLSTVTAADGTWSFTNLGVGYAGKLVYEVLPSGYVQTLGAAGYAITGTSGADQTGLNFANFEKFDISGTKFLDANGDGLTAGDSGLGGVTIFIDVDGSLTNNAGDLTTTTAANGTWSFTNLGVGYAGKLVYEVLPTGYTQTLGAAGYAITGTSGADQTGLNFANFLPPAGDGATPGFWKNWQDIANEELSEGTTGATLASKYEAVFGVTLSGGASYDPSLLQALQATGSGATGAGGQGALLRHSTAALISASSDDIDFTFGGLVTTASILSLLNQIDVNDDLFLSESEVINAVKDVYNTTAENTGAGLVFATDPSKTDLAGAFAAMNEMPHLESWEFT